MLNITVADSNAGIQLDQRIIIGKRLDVRPISVCDEDELERDLQASLRRRRIF